MNVTIPILIPSTGLNIPNICAGLTATIAAASSVPDRLFGPIVYCMPRERRRDLMDNYTFRHLVELGRLNNVPVEIHSNGEFNGVQSSVSGQCNSLLDEHSLAEAVIIQGDDVIPNVNAYSRFAISRQGLAVRTVEWGFICGAKCDIMNDRNYPDFSTDPVPFRTFKDGCSTHLRLVSDEDNFRYLFVCAALDSGFCMLNARRIRSLSEPIKFSIDRDIIEYGGEDTLFGMECIAAGLFGYFNPGVFAWHLNNPGSRFHGQEKRRIAALERIAAERDLPTKSIADAFRGR